MQRVIYAIDNWIFIDRCKWSFRFESNVPISVIGLGAKPFIKNGANGIIMDLF